MSVTDLGLLRFILDERDLILTSGDASFRITVDYGDYHHLAQSEIDGGTETRCRESSLLFEAFLRDTMPRNTRHPVRKIDASIALPSSASGET